jgi:hypothetical protein
LTDLLQELLLRADQENAYLTRSGFGEERLRALQSLGLVRQIENASAVPCPACADGHVPDVAWSDNQELVLWCPEVGRVSLEKSDIEQWVPDMNAIARSVGDSLETASSPEVLVPSRVWHFGRVWAHGVSWDLFLVRGLLWPDASRRILDLGRLQASARPIVLVPYGIPPATLWPEKRPSVVSLSELLRIENGRLLADWQYLEESLSPPSGRAPSKTVRPVNLAEKVDWTGIRVRLIGHGMTIVVSGRRYERSMEVAGLRNETTNQPGILWRLMEYFAANGGVARRPAGTKVSDALSKQVSDLKKALRRLIPALESDPIEYEKDQKLYRAKLLIETGRVVTVRLPRQMGWEQVAIRQAKANRIIVSAPASKTFLRFQKEEARAWAEAEVEGLTLSRVYTLWQLGLEDDAGHLSGAGDTLLELFRSCGLVGPKGREAALIELNQRLGGLFDAPGEALAVNPANGL